MKNLQQNLRLLVFVLCLSHYATAQPWAQGAGNTPSSTNNTIGTSNNQDFRVFTNGTERAVFTNTGNVGIGTATSSTTPQTLLMVQTKAPA